MEDLKFSNLRKVIEVKISKWDLENLKIEKEKLF